MVSKLLHVVFIRLLTDYYFTDDGGKQQVLEGHREHEEHREPELENEPELAAPPSVTSMNGTNVCLSAWRLVGCRFWLVVSTGAREQQPELENDSWS